MIGRTARRVLKVGVLLALFVTAIGALALSRFSDDPFALVFESSERASIPVPGTRDRIIFSTRMRPLFDGAPRRSLIYERSGQRIFSTDLYAPADPFAPVEVFYFPLSPRWNGPFLLLEEPGAEVLIDVGTVPHALGEPAENEPPPRIFRLFRTVHGLFLTSSDGQGKVALVLGPQPDQLTVTQGRTAVSAGIFQLASEPDYRLPSDEDPARYRIGRIEGGGTKADPLTYVPVANPPFLIPLDKPSDTDSGEGGSGLGR